MKIQILGSGGGEAYPALFCGCEHCNSARKAGGKSLRSLSQTLIDGKLLIDLPADTHMHFMQNNLNMGDIERLLITHTHADHYIPQILDTRGCDYAHNLGAEKLHIYGNEEVIKKFNGTFSMYSLPDEIRNNIVFHTEQAFKPFIAGKYTVTPLKAHHAPEEKPLNYIIDDGEKALLYLLDTGYPFPETLERIVNYGKKFDCVIMDATMGVNYYEGHMNFAENKKLKAYLCGAGVCADNAKFVIAHITHNHCGLHEELEEYFKADGIDVAYDGLSLEI